jgi:DNA-damage-inducible protein D
MNLHKETTPFEPIRRTNPAGNEFWSSRDFARVFSYNDYWNFEALIAMARTACFNNGQRLEDHFVDIDDMIGGGKGCQRPVWVKLISATVTLIRA